MQRVITTSIEAFAGAVIFVPLLLVLDKFCFHSVKRTAAYSLFAFYLIIKNFLKHKRREV